MSHPNKVKGTKFETDVQKYLRDGGLNVERLALTGTKDEGDLVVLHGNHRYEVLECKAEQRYDLPRYLRELAEERENFRQARKLPYGVGGAVILKLRQKSIGQCAVIHTVDDFFGIGAG